MMLCSFRRLKSLPVFLVVWAWAIALMPLQRCCALPFDSGNETKAQPNILFAIADDWGWPHAGSYKDPVVATPTFDRLAKEGILFHQAFVSAPSCTPSRGAILSGMHHWQLGASVNLHGSYPDGIPTYPEQLEKVGYRIGKTAKCWGPGVPETRDRQLGGPNYASFQTFLEQHQQNHADQPFCFWLGSSDPHRPYQLGSGQKSGMDLSRIRLPKCFPDHPTVRGDVADYYFEVQRFDQLVGQAVEALERAGMLDNTVIVMTGDHGMPFPRCKGNLYDTGTRVPLAIRFPLKIQAGAVSQELVSLTDLAPTFMELAGQEIPTAMTGVSLTDIFSGAPGPSHQAVVFGKERHCPNQEAIPGGYPCRGIRTQDFLYIRNYYPERWPSGTPDWELAWMSGSWLGDCDNGPTKTVIAEDNQSTYYRWCFAKRPADELYDLKSDPDQLHNLAADPDRQDTLKQLQQQLQTELKRTADPRHDHPDSQMDQWLPYTGGTPRHPDYQPPAKKKPPQ